MLRYAIFVDIKVLKMTDNVIMEELSKSYLETIANGTGYFNSVSRDYGTDLTIRKASYCSHNKRYLTMGKIVDIQVKAVTEKYVVGLDDDNVDSIKYALEVKNYNDLVRRANEAGICAPLILCVVVIPTNKDEWYTLNVGELIIRKCAFWYKVPVGQNESQNSSSITITIPKKNIVSKNFYNELFESLV